MVTSQLKQVECHAEKTWQAVENANTASIAALEQDQVLQTRPGCDTVSNRSKLCAGWMAMMVNELLGRQLRAGGTIA
jgi:hypothetical protein